jgi:uncharacterized membrane protein
MEIDNLFGLPAHPLLVHAAVVLVPLCLLGAVCMAVRPSWRRQLGVPTALLGVAAMVFVQLAEGSGEALEERVPETALVERHTEMAELVGPLVFLFVGALVAVVALDLLAARPGRRTGVLALRWWTPRLATIAMVVTVLLGAVATYEVAQTGHSGAKATWDRTPPARD